MIAKVRRRATSRARRSFMRKKLAGGLPRRRAAHWDQRAGARLDPSALGNLVVVRGADEAGLQSVRLLNGFGRDAVLFGEVAQRFSFSDLVTHEIRGRLDDAPPEQDLVRPSPRFLSDRIVETDMDVCGVPFGVSNQWRKR